MEKIESVRSFANLIMPRMETRKVSSVQQGFKGALERGRENAENDRTSLKADERPKKETAAAKDRVRDQKGKQTGKKIGKPWERPRLEKASEQKEQISDEAAGLPADSKEQLSEAQEVRESLPADEIKERIGEETNSEESSKAERAFQDLRDMASAGQIPPQEKALPGTEVLAEPPLQEAASAITNEAVSGEVQITEESARWIGHEFLGGEVRETPLPSAEERTSEILAGEGLASSVKETASRLKAEGGRKKTESESQGSLRQNEVHESKKISPFMPKSIQEDIRNLLKAEGGEELSEKARFLSEQDETAQGGIFGLSDARIRISAGQSAFYLTKAVGAERSEASLAAKVLDEVKISLGQNKNEMKIQLHPETLGKLTVKLTSENGVMNASFFAENDKAKQIIESQMAELRRTLETQGIQVQNLSVTVDSGKDELSRHKNIMEAKKYSKLTAAERQTDIMEAFAELQNPYVLEDEFSEMV